MYKALKGKMLKKTPNFIKKTQAIYAAFQYNINRNGVADLKIIHKITKDREKTYYTVPFTVEDGVEKITITYSYPNATKGLLGDMHPVNTVDIGLMNQDGKFLGWSGSARNKIEVGEYSSTKGYLSEPIIPGEWKIIVGAYHIAESGVEVAYNIDFKKKERQLLFGDLHIHSDASDGKFDAYKLAHLSKKRELDFIALANHNNCSENRFLPHVDDFTFIPAVEWTHYNGHMNFFGVEEPFENSFIANNEAEAEKLIAHARSLGAVISVNHPKCRICPYLWKNENFDAVEVWNGPMRPTNNRGIAFWTELLRKGRRIPAVGGSDYHKPLNPARIGNPVTAVLSASRSSRDILEAVKNGHSFITDSVRGARLLINCGKAEMGDTVDTEERLLKITGESLKGESLVLVTDTKETVALKNCRGSVKITVSLEKDATFAYVKAVYSVGKTEYVRAITNPIYLRNL